MICLANSYFINEITYKSNNYFHKVKKITIFCFILYIKLKYEYTNMVKISIHVFFLNKNSVCKTIYDNSCFGFSVNEDNIELFLNFLRIL